LNGPGLGQQAPAVSRHHDASGACAVLHLMGAFGLGLTGTSTSPIIPVQRNFFIRTATPG
jgi:hypothetical protein